jgi:hypothetical protein
MQDWCRLAAAPAVVRRALAMAAIVGALLIGINHGAALVRGDVDRGRLVRMALTLVVPYCVSTVSSVGALRSGADNVPSASGGLPGGRGTERVPSWWEAACEPHVVRRAVWCMGVVGAILIGINHGHALLRGESSGGRIWQVGLTFLVPYTVSTVSSVGALRSRAVS